MFIVFEGPEGCGKSTQTKLIDEHLRGEGIQTLVTREPGGSPSGEKIRDILLDAENRIDLRAELLLYMASRAQIVDETIRPALAEGKTVLCERFLSSTIVYQGIAGGADVAFIENLGRFSTDGLTPDLTVVIDIDAAKGLSRVGTPDRIESRGQAYHERVRQGFLALAEQNPDRFAVIDGNRTLQEVSADVIKAVNAKRSRLSVPEATA